MLKKFAAIAVIHLLILLQNTVSFSQTDSQPTVMEAIRTANCEFAAAIFDTFAQGTESGKNIIVVSYKGKKESVKDIAARRLHNAETYLTEYYKTTRFSRSQDKVITGVGTEATEEGRLDFYVDGQLKLRMFFLNNRDLILSPCYVESGDYCKDEMKKLFFPCIKTVKKRAATK